MANIGKCPKCGNVVAAVHLERVDVVLNGLNQFHGVSYVCPNATCRAVLGVSIDPIAIKTDIVGEILKKQR